MKTRLRLHKWLLLATGILCLSVAAMAVTHAVPTVTAPVNPQAVPVGNAFTLTVYGAGFVRGAVVNWNGNGRATTFVSTRELQAQILSSDVANPTTGFITVTNPAPGGGNSSSSYGVVEVHAPITTIALNAPKLYDRNVSSWSTLVADFNGDGKLDIISGSAPILCLLGNGDGTFDFGSFIARNLVDPPRGMAFGDFNGDGKLDFAFTQDNSISVFLGDGTGSFTLKGTFGSFTDLRRIVVGDFNRDGKLDIAAADYGGYTGQVSILLGNGDGTFQTQTNYTSLSQPIDLVTADFNGDGNLDLAVASNTKGGSVSLMMGNGNGTFGTPHTTVLSKGVGFNTFGRVLAVDDFNRDGAFDLAVLRNDEIGILLNKGKGAFQPIVYYTTGGNRQAESFTVGDFNSDGKTDLMVSVEPGPKINVRFGNGDGTFQSTVTVLKGSGSALGLAPGDFNSDGLLDVTLQQFGDYVYVQQ